MRDGIGMSDEVVLAIVAVLCLTAIACVESCNGKQQGTMAQQAAEEAAR